MNPLNLTPPHWWLVLGTGAGLFDAWLVLSAMQTAAAAGCLA